MSNSLRRVTEVLGAYRMIGNHPDTGMLTRVAWRPVKLECGHDAWQSAIGRARRERATTDQGKRGSVHACLKCLAEKGLL